MNGRDNPRTGWAPEGLRLAAPPDDLAELVECSWQIDRGHRPDEPPYLPVATFELVFTASPGLGASGGGALAVAAALLVPPRLAPATPTHAAPQTVFGVRLWPDVLARTGLCRAADAAAHPALGTLCGDAVADELAAIVAAPGFEGRCQAAAALLRRVRALPGLRPASATDRAALADFLATRQPPRGASARRALQRAFTRWVGISPAAFLLVDRFTRALAAAYAAPAGRASLAALAHELGFSDQAHMTRHFRRYAGASPRRFLAAVEAWFADRP